MELFKDLYLKRRNFILKAYTYSSCDVMILGRRGQRFCDDSIKLLILSMKMGGGRQKCQILWHHLWTISYQISEWHRGLEGRQSTNRTSALSTGREDSKRERLSKGPSKEWKRKSESEIVGTEHPQVQPKKNI